MLTLPAPRRPPGHRGASRLPRWKRSRARGRAQLLRARGRVRTLCEGGPRLHASCRRRPGRRALPDHRPEALRRRRRPDILEGELLASRCRWSWPGCSRHDGELFARYRRRAESSLVGPSGSERGTSRWTSSPAPQVETLRERILDVHGRARLPAGARDHGGARRRGGAGRRRTRRSWSRSASGRRAEGLWNLFMPDERFGPGLTNWEYGLLCEEMGRSRGRRRWSSTARRPTPATWRSSPSTARTSSSERWLEPLLERRDPLLLLDDRARGRRAPTRR